LPSARSKVEIGPEGVRSYDLSMDVIFLGYYPHLIRKVVEKMDIRRGQSILSLGSGTGRNECLMAEKLGPEGRVL
jgi:ubiquinone/menaquinone biosynthesis C-methylase UbiE